MKTIAVAAASAGVGLLIALAGAADAATIRLVALVGQEAPGAGGAEFLGLGAPTLNNAGETAFLGVLVERSTFAIDTGIFTSRGLVARQGDVAPGAGGATFSGFGAPDLNDSGEIAFFGSLAGAGVQPTNGGGIFTLDRLVARLGITAPGAGIAVFSDFGRPALNNSGETASLGVIRGSGVTFENNTGIFTAGALSPREGDAAPGAGGAVFSGFTDPALNDAGRTAFTANLAGSGVTGANNVGVFASGALVARRGDAAPGAGGAVFSTFGAPALNNSGETAFRGSLTGAGVTLANNDGVFTSGALVAREGDAAPGAGGAMFSLFDDPALNDMGDVAFRSVLTGAGVADSDNEALFATRGGVLDLVLREGDMLDIGGGDLRTITSLFLTQGGFNNDGDIAFLASFSAGASGRAGTGIFVYEAASVSAAVPLPPALGFMLFSVAALGFAGRRRARA